MRTTRLELAGGLLVLGPLLASAIRDHKAAIGQARSGALDAMDMMELTCQLAYACAVRVQPSITLANVEDLVDLENTPQVFAACWGVSVPEPAPGEALQAVQQENQST